LTQWSLTVEHSGIKKSQTGSGTHAKVKPDAEGLKRPYKSGHGSRRRLNRTLELFQTLDGLDA